MSASLRKAKTAKGRRLQKKREPKIIEGDKKAIFLKTTTASQLVSQALADLCTLKAPFSKQLSHRNPLQPFEDGSSLEFLTQVNDSSLFVVGSNNKKRPHALTFGRTFDGQILDMMEFTLDPSSFRSIQQLSAERQTLARLGATPMVLFIGDVFETSEDMKQFRSLILDFFHIQDSDKINLAGLDRVIQITASVNPNDLSKKLVTFRHYTVQKKKGQDKFPKVVLEEAGPRLDLNFTRATRASRELQALSMKKHKQATIKHAKNVEMGYMGEKLGRLHMEKQDFNQIALKKTKSLGKGKRANIVAPLKELDYKAGGVVRKKPEIDDGDFSDDMEKIVKGSTKRQKTLPSAYIGSIISE